MLVVALYLHRTRPTSRNVHSRTLAIAVHILFVLFVQFLCVVVFCDNYIHSCPSI